ncbi:MAG: putative thermolysin family peptidase [Acidimicrobiales bacterium]|nr:putative thermolysin family peptidase [Acidimicrobiales bacterium]
MASAGLLALVVGSMTVVTPPTVAAPASPLALARPAVAALASRLQRVTGGTATFAVRPGTGDVTFIGSVPHHPLRNAPAEDDGSAADASDAARRFVDDYGQMFGVEDASTDLTQLAVFDGQGGDAVRFQQSYEGLPVLAGQVAVQVDDAGAVLSATGEASPQLAIPVAGTVTAESAASTARALTARASGLDPTALTVSAPALWVYDPALLGAPDPLGARVVWRIDVRSALGDIDRLVLIDATKGTVALQFSQQEQAKNRSVCDDGGTVGAPETCSAPTLTEANQAAAYAGSSSDARAAFDNAGVTYDFYNTMFGRDSINGAGLPITSTVRFCPSAGPCRYHNAYWNGKQMIYGQGYSSALDVVGHELTHGVTQYTSGLFYYADTGAINESMSDVMGELIQLSTGASDPNWLIGETLPSIAGQPPDGPIRSMKNPPTFNDPDTMTSPRYIGTIGDGYGVHTNSGVDNKAAYLMAVGVAAPGFNGQIITGIGNTKTADIYYYANTTLLTPGSDYLDLFRILPQACTNLIGTVGITAGDCAQVTKAVTATEMNKRATKAGAVLTAPVCDSGNQIVRFNDDMETNTGNWVSSQTGAGAPWSYSTDSSQSGSRSLHVDDVAGPGSATVTEQAAVGLPAGQNAYLRFDHSFSTDSDPDAPQMYDGGVVEYTTNGTTWQDIGGLPTINGYNGTIQNGFSDPLQGRSAFGLISPNYQTTRVDLSSLAGQSVRFRFAFGEDSFTEEYPGWFIDDLAIYSCSTLPGAPASVIGSPGNQSATVTWTTPTDGGSPITGYTVASFVNGAPSTTYAVPGGTNTVTLTGLTNGTPYTFTVSATTALGTGPPSAATPIVSPSIGFQSFVPARLMDTRSDGSTIDGQYDAIGVRPAGTVTSLLVAGRGGVASDAATVVLNVTVTEAQGAGFVTVYPCGSDPPTASNINAVEGSTIPNAVIVKVGAGGQVCLFNQLRTHLVVDVNGYFPLGSSLTSLVPGRLFDSRPGQPTADGQLSGGGQRPAGSVTVVPVLGRAGVPNDATAVALNMTVTEAQFAGFVTVYPCGGDPPLASNLNYSAGQTIANAAVTKVGTGGAVCVLTQSPIQLVVDVNGFAPAGSKLVPIVPARLLESRGGASTTDGESNAIGLRPAGAVTVVRVAGRAVVPLDATAAVLNVTVTEATAPGFATVFPCGGDPPTASNLNYGAGTTIANAVISRIAADGTVCVFTQQATHLVIDVNGYFNP